MEREPDATEEALELTGRAGRADPDAQRALVTRLLGPVRRTVASLLRGDAEADDAVQVAMIEILKSAATYRGVASLERWAGRIAVRAALRLVRERRTRTEPLEARMDTSELPHTPQGVADELPPRAIEAYLAELSEERRTCVVLRHMHGYTVEEIAGMTHVSPNTVKDRLLQGRARLRQLVRRDEAIGASRADARRTR